MLEKTEIVLFLVALSVSCGQAWAVKIHHSDYKSLYPAILNFNHDYMGPQDDMKSLPDRYEILVHRLYNYLVSPKDKYLNVLSRTNFTFEQIPGYEESDEVYKYWKNITLEDDLKNPDLRSQLVLTMITNALDRLVDSCEDLEETISPLIINDESKPLENANGLNTKEKQIDMEVILIEVKSAKLALKDLQNRVNFYIKRVHHSTDFAKKIGGLSLQGLLRYTVSAMTSVRGSWIGWKVMSHYANEPEA